MDWLHLLVANFPLLAYGAVLIAIIFEGEISILLFGILSREGYLFLPTVFMFCFLGAVLHDFLFWKIGSFLSSHHRIRFLCFNIDKLAQLLRARERSLPLLACLSKFAWNFNKPMLLAAGYICIPYRRIVLPSIMVSFLWAAFFLFLGYMFADQTELFRSRIKGAGIFITAVLILVLVFESYLYNLVSRYLNIKSSTKSDLR